MRWSDCHRGNIAQAPVEGQPVVNPKLKVPDDQNPLVQELKEEEEARVSGEATPRRATSHATSGHGQAGVSDRAGASDKAETERSHTEHERAAEHARTSAHQADPKK